MLSNESKTLIIPLVGKAMMSKEKILLNDLKAEEIINDISKEIVVSKQSRWLSMYMSLRASLIDDICNKYLEYDKDLIVVHLGCGLDSRCLRVRQKFKTWYDIDFENVIALRKKYYHTNQNYKMIGKSVMDYSWMDEVEDTKKVLIVAEGLTMYLTEWEICELLKQINERFATVYLVFDAYTKWGVKLSKIKNPVNKFDAQIKYGINVKDDFLKLNKQLEHVKTYMIRKEDNGLKGVTKLIFNKLYCGKLSQKLYRIYEFKLKSND